MKKKFIAASLLALAVTPLLAGCETEANVASDNLATAAEQFKIERSIIFYNGITGEVMLSIEGRCSLEDQGNQLEVTCRIGPNEYTKDLLGLSDNVTYYAHQLETTDVSVYHHTVVLKPENFVPGFEFDAGKQ